MVTGLTSNASASIVTIGSFAGAGTNTTGGINHSLSASAVFKWDNVANQLLITLTNTTSYNYTTANSNKMVPSDVLTALFFDVAPNQAFTQGNPFAVVAPGSTVVNGPTPAGGNVTAPSPTLGGWRYNYDTNQLPQNQGLGTAGFNIFQGSEVNQGPGGPFNYGLIGSNYSPGEGNDPVNATPFVRSSVVFTLNGLSSSVSITNLRFQYGTALDEPNFTPIVIPGGDEGDPVPEPTSLALAGIAGLGLVFGRFRKRRQAA